MKKQLITFKKVLKKELEYVSIMPAQIIYCTDSREIFLDNLEMERINITTSSIYFNNYEELEAIYNPLINKIYIAGNSIYRFLNDKWDLIEFFSEVEDVISDLDEFEKSILCDKNTLIAPRTLANNVFMDDGSRLTSALDSTQILKVIKTKAVYVEADNNSQRVFNIPFPKENYDFLRGDHMSVIIRGNLIECERYHINNGNLILDSTVTPLNMGEIVLFIFYYQINYDLNENCIIGTKNLENGCVTNEKLSSDISISAKKIVETVERLFFTPEERSKLNGIDYNATNYHHPATHPAEMIDTTEQRRFITDQQIERYDGKADADSVYTKEETRKLIDSVIGSAPEALDTLVELAKALGDDPNFASTITTELNKKATNVQLEDLKSIVNKKVYINDYVRNTIYTTPTVIDGTDTTIFGISLDDQEFNEYIDGMSLTIKIKETNRFKSFIRINQLNQIPILTQDGFEIIEGELHKDSIYTLKYNGATRNFILQGKGGVTIKDASQTKYEINTNQFIKRGELVDIDIYKKISKSIPKAKIISKNDANDTKFYCNGKIKVLPINSKYFLVIWKDNNSLKAQVFNLDSNDFININNSLNPTILNLNCARFDAVKLNENKFMVCYTTNLNIVTCVVIRTYSNRTDLVVTNTYDKQDDGSIGNICIHNVQDDEAILNWECSNGTTKTMLFDVPEYTIDILSSRTNNNYPINENCIVNKNQILFGKIEGKEISLWIMGVNEMDFTYSSIEKVYTDTNYELANLSLTNINDNKILVSFTNKEETQSYKLYVQITFNGGLKYTQPTFIRGNTIDIKESLLKNQKHIVDDFFVQVSNIDQQIPSLIGMDKKHMKICINKINFEDFKTVYKLTDIDFESSEIAYDFLDKQHLIVIFNAKNNIAENNYLHFVYIQIKKEPNGVSLENGIQGEVIRIKEW